MYTVFYNARPAGNKKFFSYETARRFARKLIRQKWSCDVSNPSIGEYGYTVRRV